MLTDGLLSYDFTCDHFDYDTITDNIFHKYIRTIDASNDQSIFDRSFISEIVYGNVIRQYSRISYNQLEDLIHRCAEKNAIIVYLYAPQSVLLFRKRYDGNDTKLLQNYYDKLCEQYELLLQQLSQYVPVLRLNATYSPHELVNAVSKFYQQKRIDIVYVGNLARDKYVYLKKEFWGGSAFHSSIASALFGECQVGIISGIGKDFEEEIFDSLGIINICGKSEQENCNVFQKDLEDSSFKLLEEKYVTYPPFLQRIYTNHLHVSFRYGVPVEDILNNPMLRYQSLSIDVMHSSIDFAIEMICRFKNKISLVFCNLQEYEQIKEYVFSMWVVVTNEYRPITLWRNGIMQQLAIVPVNDKVIRADGAGDSFIGGFLSISQTFNFRKNMIRGIAASWAAVACEKRYELSQKDLVRALEKTEKVNKKFITKIPKHIIVIGNPCSGKSLFVDYIVDYFSNYYISIDDYNSLYNVFFLDDAIRTSSDVCEVLNKYRASNKVTNVINKYFLLYKKGILETSLFTKSNCNGGYDILRPELWDLIIEDSLKELCNGKHYIFELSRGTDQQYMSYKAITKYQVYDSAILMMIEKLHCSPDEVLIVNLTADYETRIMRNNHRALCGGHYVSDMAMKNIYAEDIFATRYPNENSMFTVGTFSIPFVTINNNVTTTNIKNYMFDIMQTVLNRYNA